jgi:hypothetical protein
MFKFIIQNLIIYNIMVNRHFINIDDTYNETFE